MTEHDLALSNADRSKVANVLDHLLADSVSHQPTAELARTRQQLHGKSSWMLRSFLG